MLHTYSSSCCFCYSYREMLRLLQTVLILSLCIRTVHSCVNNYFLFEELTFGNNSENRLKLYQASTILTSTCLTQWHIVTYRNFSNGTHVDISTDPSCPHEQVWIWLAHPIFVIQEPASLNHLTLFMLYKLLWGVDIYDPMLNWLSLTLAKGRQRNSWSEWLLL